MAYEPLTPYKSKDDPLWYVFDEDQNFKSFDTRDKALKHIRATKYPLNEGIDLDTAYNSQNKEKVQNSISRIDSFNVAEGNDITPVEPIFTPKKIKPEFREVKDINAVMEAVGALEKGTRGFGKLVIGGGSKGLSEPWINSPYGYSIGDKDINTKDVNHKEYLEAKKYFDSIKPELMSKGEFTHENVNRLLKEQGFKNSSLSNTGTLWTDLSIEQQNENLEKSIIHTYASKFEEVVMKNPVTVESWDQIEDSYVNMLFETIPNVGGIIGASMINPALGMSVAGTMMAGESWTLAEPYIQSGKISPSDAGDMAMLVGASSMLLNYLPATVWSSNPILKKQFEKSLFDKLSKKQIYNHFNKVTAKEIFTEAVTESIDENILMYGESQYRDITLKERSERSLLAFTMGGVVSTGISGSLNWANKNQLSTIFNDSENVALPSFMSIDKSGDVSFNVKEENFSNKEDYEYVKSILTDPELKKRLNPSALIKKYPNVPANLVVFHELISTNPNLADIEMNFDIAPQTDYMTEQELLDRNEDPNSPEWEKVLVKKGEYLYNEKEKTYKVYKGGSNILNDTNGVINLTQGANQDVYVEEITELLYKKLKTTNPELRKKIDTWIADMTKVLNNNGAGGPRNIELFSKFYTFNYMGYKSDVYDLSDIVVIPQDILNEFDSIMGEQENGPNISFMFKGKEPNIIKENDPLKKGYVNPSDWEQTQEEKKQRQEDRKKKVQENIEDKIEERKLNKEEKKRLRELKKEEKRLDREEKQKTKELKKEQRKLERIAAREKRKLSREESKKLRQEKREARAKEKELRKEQRILEQQNKEVKKKIAPLMQIPKSPKVKMGKPIVGDKESFRLSPQEIIDKKVKLASVVGDPIVRGNKVFVENTNFEEGEVKFLPITDFGNPEEVISRFETLAEFNPQPGREINQPVEAEYYKGKLVLTDGANRYNQAFINGDKTIPVIVSKGDGSKLEESFRLTPNKEYRGDEVRDKIYSVLPDKDTEANLRKKVNRDPKVGSPKNKSKTLTNEKYRMTIGEKTIDQWIKDAENNMTPEQIMEARIWYDNYIDDVKPLTELSDGSLDSSLRFVLGSLVTQVNESPEGSINNLLMAFEEESSGSKSSKKAGLNNDAVRQLFTKDGKIKGGVGQKLFDFIDSAIGNNTRYIMGNDPKGGSPYTADIHTSRGRGFIDQTFLDALERAFGKNKIKSLSTDFGGNPTETQYENVSAFGNQLTKKLNDINWMGQEWTTQQVQAVDWVNIVTFLGDYGIKAGGTMGDAILGNTQTVSSALVFGEGTPYSKKFSKIYDMDFEQQLKITSKVNPEIAKEASKLTGVKAKVEFNQQGFWKDNASEPTTTMTIISSKDGIQSFLDALGYLAQQTEVLGTRNNKTGKNAVLYFYDLNSKFKNLDKQKEFYNKLRKIAPEEISGASSDYYMIEGKKIPAISIITDFKAPSKITIVQEKADFLLNKSNEFINLHKESLESLSDLDIDVTVVLGDKVKSSNDWKENSNGEDYIQRLSKRYGRGIQKRLEDSSRRIESLLETEINQEKSNQENESNRLTPSFSEVQQKYIESREFFITKIQDELRRLKVIQEKIGDIPEEQDAYMRAELYIGKASEKIENFRTKEIEPLVKELTDDGFTIEDIGDYLYARHSKERNTLISERTDGEVKDGSGMSNKDANEILNKFKNTKIKDYAKKVDAIIGETLDILYDGDLITLEDYEYYDSKKMFKNYVPLKGLPGDETYFASGKGFSVTGKDIKRAKGRGSRANNPFVQVLADYEQAIVRSEKNKVSIAFYNLVENNPSEMWEAKGLKHLPRFDKNGEVQYFDPMQLKPNEIEVKVEGKRKIITINDADLVNQMKKMGSSQPLKGLITFNNFFRAINTTLNPEFIITNFSRDLQAGLFNLNADHKGLTKKVLKYVFKAQKGIWTNIRGGKSEWASIYQEYKDNGGKVGWFEQQTIEQKTEKLKKVLKNAQSKNQFGTAFRSVGKFINDANEMVESGVRLATYKALVEAGVSPKKSAQYSKNLTVNFNKKGEWGSAINSIWVFSNASIQGTTRVMGMGSTKRGKAIQIGLIAMGFLQSFINRMTDSEDWEQFDDYVKDNYWMYLLPNGKALSIKAPYGYNVFKVMGSLIEEMIFGDTTLPEAGKRFVVSVNDAFNPIGGGSLLQAFSPTITDPFVQIVENKNFFGGPIMPEQPAYQPKIADKKRYFPSARKQSKAITNWLNKITGGGEDISGWVDVSPETLDHFFDSYTGGVGKFVANTIESGTSLAVDGKFPSPTNVPIKRQFYKDQSEWVSRKLLRDMVNESKRIKYSAQQKNRLLRHIKYLKESDFDRERYKTKIEWFDYLKKEKEEFFKNQRDIK